MTQVNLFRKACHLRDIANTAQRLADDANRAALAARAEADKPLAWNYKATP